MATNQLRARDRDRADICGLLDTALAEGQLTAGEHEQRTAAAMRAKSFGELDALIDDLQIPGDLVNVPVLRGRRRSRPWWIPVGVVAAALAFGALGGLSAGGEDQPAARAVLPDTTTAAGIADFVEVYRAEFGDTVADEASFYPDHVSVDRYDPVTRVQTSYTYRDGEFDDWTTSTSRAAEEPTLDLGEIDLTALAGLLAGAPQTAKAPGGTIDYISVTYESSRHGAAEPMVEIFVENEAKSDRGWFQVAFDGEPLAVHPID
ncbi:DUF1707 SHOCT-like domain-containing protein [Nocardia sp. NBC_01329]|uniref:DUF1707 SHOCT-like domain-containing protein n=1 Tax=Nocardia sp. NBC_01329 TaxID=2903594 RepID=UPI002E0D5CA3|nr:DUF1707 domain-containing protein [Nocardia sp. NBC_01329]